MATGEKASTARKSPPKKRAPRKKATPKPAENKDAVDPIAAAKAMIAQNRLAREKACTAAIQALLEQHKCIMKPRIIVADGHQELGVDILAQD